MSGNRIRVGVYMEQGKAFMAHEIANYPAHQEGRATQLIQRIRAAVRLPPTHPFEATTVDEAPEPAAYGIPQRQSLGAEVVHVQDERNAQPSR